MDDKARYIQDYLALEKKTLEALSQKEIHDVVDAVLDAYEHEGTIYICGNGGSASTASHAANDFNKGISEYVDKKWHFYCLNDKCIFFVIEKPLSQRSQRYSLCEGARCQNGGLDRLLRRQSEGAGGRGVLRPAGQYAGGGGYAHGPGPPVDERSAAAVRAPRPPVLDAASDYPDRLSRLRQEPYVRKDPARLS